MSRQDSKTLSFDQRMMARALDLARRGTGRVEPNPLVGCVIALRSRILGEGYHKRFGGPHAEIEAIRACGSSVRGATVYVTLEPCCHTGKTPPCVDALIDAGVRRVVVAMVDPHRHAAGRGLKQLRRAGILTETGLCHDQAAELLAPCLTRLHLHRPFVIAKWAQSLDGRLSTAEGDSQWISNEASRRLVHRIRARVDAIMVGSGTVLKDDPLLTARGVPIRRRAVRVIVDARLRVPLKSQLVTTARHDPTLILTTRKAAQSVKAQRLQRLGVQVEACRSRKGKIDLANVLEELSGRGMTNILVEGGPTLLTSFFEKNFVDEAYVFTAPIFIGGRDARSALGGKGISSVAAAMKPRTVSIRKMDDNVLHRLRFTSPPLRPMR